MDIGWAVKALKDGAKVRRRIWAHRNETPGNTYWSHLYLEDRPEHATTVMVRHTDGTSGVFTMIDFHLLAEDWELA